MDINSIHRGIMFHDIFELYGTNWKVISSYPNLPEEFIDAYYKMLKPYSIENKQTITRRLQLKYRDTLNWILMSKFQTLDEDVIELMQNQVSWPYISKYQALSESFIRKHSNKLIFDLMKINPKISATVLCSVKNLFEK